MIASKTIFIAPDAVRPDCFQTGSAMNAAEWVRVSQQPGTRELDRELSKAGWTFFYIAERIRSTVLGINRQRVLDVALSRIIKAAKSIGCNSIQIDSVASRSFLWITCVTVSAHLRHIQKGMVFTGPHSLSRYEARIASEGRPLPRLTKYGLQREHSLGRYRC